MRTTLSTFFAILISTFAAVNLSAQTFPTKPITLIVAGPAGSTLDVNARVVARVWAEKLGQPVIIENRAGAGGNIAAQTAVNAKPDGYSVLYGTTSTMASNKWLYKNLAFDPIKDLIPVHGFVVTPLVVLINADRPEKSLNDLVATAKAQPDAIRYGSAGVGSLTHLGPEFMQRALDIKFTHVPYNASLAQIDLIAGRIEIIFEVPVTAAPLIAAGKVRGLVLLDKERSPALPNVPSAGELGHPELILSSWGGIFAPAATPQPIVGRLASTFGEALKDPVVQKHFETVGSALFNISGAPFKKFVDSESARWKDVIEKAGITVEGK